MDINRRRFLEAAAAGAAITPALGAAEAPKLPTRPFGRTGMTVPILGFGSGSRFLMYRDEDKALEALNRAIDLGITYIDTAHSYGDGKSEERIGRVMATRRKEVILATKLMARTADDARRQIETSLKRLQTDRLDVLHIHDLKGPEDLAAIQATDGILKALYEARDQKVARAIGITCHASPPALKLALERHDFDATQMALNAAFARMVDAPGGMKSTPMAPGRLRGAGPPRRRPQADGHHRHEGLRPGPARRGGPARDLVAVFPLAPRQPGQLRDAEARVHREERRRRPGLRADVRARPSTPERLDRRRPQGLDGVLPPGSRRRLTCSTPGRGEVVDLDRPEAAGAFGRRPQEALSAFVARERPRDRDPAVVAEHLDGPPVDEDSKPDRPVDRPEGCRDAVAGEGLPGHVVGDDHPRQVQGELAGGPDLGPGPDVEEVAERAELVLRAAAQTAGVRRRPRRPGPKRIQLGHGPGEHPDAVGGRPEG